MMSTLAILPLAVLLAGVLLEILLGRVLKNAAKGWLAFLAALLAAGLVAAMIPTVTAQGALTLPLGDWDKGIRLVYHVDGLSILFSLMATLIGAAILLYCVRYMESEPQGTTRFYALMLAFIAGLVNLVCSENLLVAYVSWELIGLCSYFLVGFWYKENAAVKGARKVLVITHLAGYALLAGILLLFGQSGSLLWNDPAVQPAFTSGIFLLFLVAAMAKSVVFPLHTWIPEAMNAPTPVSALLHSACYVKAGIYLIARLYSISPWQPAWNTLVLVLGCVTMLVGALFALAQTDLKRLLAYSTISQLGHIITALGLGTSLGVYAALFYTVSHGLFKGTLFLCSGVVQHAAGTRDMRRLGGLAARMPATTRVWWIAAAAIIGIPLTNGFVAKWLLLNAALSRGQALVVLVAWLVSVLTAFYILKATAGVFYGEMPADLRERKIHDASPTMRAGMGFLGGLCLLFGAAPQLMMNLVIRPAVIDLSFSEPVQVTWLGFQTGATGLDVTGGALVLLAALVLGGLIYLAARPRPQVDRGTFSGGDPLPAGAPAYSVVDFTDTVESAAQPVYRVTDPDPLYLAGWRVVQRLSGGFGRMLAPVEERPQVAIAVMAILLMGLALLIG